jgi:hypothetical protein
LEEPHGPVPVLTNAQHPRRQLISGKVVMAWLSASCTSHHDTPNEAAVSGTALPEPITAETTASHNRPVDRANRGTCAVASVNESRGHNSLSQNQRRLAHTNSTGPARGVSRSRWNRRSFRRAAITPHVGQPGGTTDSIVILRCPKGNNTALTTR